MKSTREACAIVGMDADRFNEHVASGRFSGAPKTMPGVARYFDDNDMVALWLFAELMRNGYKAEEAGGRATQVRAMLKLSPDAEQVIASTISFWPKPIISATFGSF